MEMTFQEVELVKVLLEQSIAGAAKIKEIGENDFQAVIAFLGVQDGDEHQAKRAMELLMQQRDDAEVLLQKINEEYGLGSFEEKEVPVKDETARGQMSVIGKCRKQFEMLCESDGIVLQPIAVLEGYIVFTYNANPMMRERLLWHLKSIYEEQLLKQK